MRIDAAEKLSLFTSTKPETKEKVKAEESGVRSVRDSYRLEASDLFELAKTSEEVRYEKIQAIKERIENGSYGVTGKDVIAKVLEEKLW